ncbi:MAG: CCA tRNA nucleotidyltransferase [Pseudomonadota bacterium]
MATDIARLNADWLQHPDVGKVFAALGHENIRLVGGCVRDGLIGQPVSDLDFATRHTPERTITLAEKAGFKAIPTGLEHGTVTLVTGESAFEVTTLREDVETDGRHATVEFTLAWWADAARRDFTVNALYADAAGQVFDYFGGLDDLEAGIVQFIGDPHKRIEEDALRILRFYRFSARYATALDAAGREACRHWAGAIKALSRERVHTEWFKMLSAAQPMDAIEAMDEDGVLRAFLPEADIDGLQKVVEHEAHFAVHANALRRFAAALPADPKTAEKVARRLKCSNAQRADLIARTQRLTEPVDAHVMIYKCGANLAIDLALLSNLEPSTTSYLLHTAQTWEPPKFPLRGQDLLEHTQLRGAQMGKALHTLEERWIDSGFTLSAPVLLAQAEQL